MVYQKPFGTGPAEPFDTGPTEPFGTGSADHDLSRRPRDYPVRPRDYPVPGTDRLLKRMYANVCLPQPHI